MENVMSFRRMKRDKALEREINGLMREIHEVCAGIDAALCRFREETDFDLIDAWIYEQEFYEARYRYLLRRARSLGMLALPRLKSF